MDINSLLSGLLGGLGQSDTAIKAEQPRAAATTAGIETAGTNMDAFIQDSIVKGALATQQAAEIERQKMAAGETAQTIANLNPDDLNNAYVQSMAQLTDVQMQREAAMQEYRKLTETSFLDNPVGYIFNQLALPQVVQKHNNLATQQDAITGDLATRTQLMYQNKTQVTANVADATKEAKLTESAAQVAAAQANAEKVRMDNFGKVSTSRMNELALQDKIIQNASTRYNAGMNMATFKAQQQEREDARAERKLRMDEAAKDKVIKDAQEGALAVGLARVSGALGYPAPVTLDDFKKMPASKSKQALYNAAIEGTFGDDLSTSLSFVKSGNGPRMQQQDPAFVSGVKAIDAGVQQYKNDVTSRSGNEKLKLEEVLSQAAAEYTVDVVAAAHDPKTDTPLNDPKWDVMFNPYRSQDATLLSLVKAGQMPTLANNSFVKIMGTVAATMPPGTPEFRGEDRTNSIKALAELVSSRKITVQQAAADLVAYTQAAAEYNQKTMKLASLNMPVQTNSVVKIPGYSFTSRAKVGDIMNIASTENLLTSLATDKTAGKFAGPGGFWR